MAHTEREKVCSDITKKIGDLELKYCYHHVGKEVSMAYKDNHIGVFFKTEISVLKTDFKNLMTAAYGVKMITLYDALRKSRQELNELYHERINHLSEDFRSASDSTTDLLAI
jgi:hypothetical protein